MSGVGNVRKQAAAEGLSRVGLGKKYRGDLGLNTDLGTTAHCNAMRRLGKSSTCWLGVVRKTWARVSRRSFKRSEAAPDGEMHLLTP
eukprot:14770948-Alexandrium_andersonii.AAC.1